MQTTLLYIDGMFVTPQASDGFETIKPAKQSTFAKSAVGDAVNVDLAVDAADGFWNSGIIAVRTDLLWSLLSKVRNKNRKDEYYLNDIVAIARAHGYHVTIAEVATDEVTDDHFQADLAALEDRLAINLVGTTS